jgi:uncharacterized membrane protein
MGLRVYDIFKFLHVLGAVLLIGNVTVTAFWKVFADRTGDARLVAHAQAGVTATEWIFTLPAILLVIAGGYGMVIQSGHDLTSSWLMLGQVLFALSGLIWLFILVPLQVRQARLAKNLSPDKPIDEHYRQLGHRWLVWGIAATVPLIAATYVMIAR